MSEPNNLLEHRVSAVEKAVERIAEAVHEIAQNTTTIARLEVKHGETRDGLDRAFNEIAKLQSEDVDLDQRLRDVEIEMPGLRDIRDLVRRAMYSIVGLVGLAVIAVVLKGGGA